MTMSPYAIPRVNSNDEPLSIFRLQATDVTLSYYENMCQAQLSKG